MKTLPYVVVIAITAGAGYYFFKNATISATIGSTEVRKADVKLRDEVVRVYFPEEKRNMGFQQLYKSAVNLEILKSNGVEFTQEQVLAEEKRIQENTRDPQTLQKIRALFGEDHDAFLRSFILPTLADRYIYNEFFLNSPHVHADSFLKAKELLAELAATPSDMAGVAKRNSLRSDIMTIDLNKGLHFASLEKKSKIHPRLAALAEKSAHFLEAQSVRDAQAWHDQLLAQMSVGQIYPAPISFGENWVISRYIKKISEQEHQVEMIFVPKLNFADWYRQQKAKISIRVSDKALLPAEM
jgi:hypothetical protein